MAEIEELRQRVEAAQKRFGLLDEQQKHYSERLVGLMDVVDDGIRQQRAEADDLQGEVQKLARENDELKSMLQTLLQAMEEGSTADFVGTMRTLESRAGALVEAAESTAALTGPGESTATPSGAQSEAAPETAADDNDNAVADIPATPPTPWDDESTGDAEEDASPQESEPAPPEAKDDRAVPDPDPDAAQTAADEEDGGDEEAAATAGPDDPANDEEDGFSATRGSHAVEERVKRLIEMTEMSPPKTQS